MAFTAARTCATATTASAVSYFQDVLRTLARALLALTSCRVYRLNVCVVVPLYRGCSTCPCGKQDLAVLGVSRTSCLDPLPTCGEVTLALISSRRPLRRVGCWVCGVSRQCCFALACRAAGKSCRADIPASPSATMERALPVSLLSPWTVGTSWTRCCATAAMRAGPPRKG